MKEPLSQGSAPGGPTGRWLTLTTSTATLWRILPWSTSIFMKKEHYEEFNIERKHYWAALRPQECPQNVTFEDNSGANQWRHGAIHERVVLKRSGLLVHLIVIERTIFCVAFLREMLIGPPQQDVASDHLHLGVVHQPPQGGLQEGIQLVQVEAGGGRCCWGLFFLLNVKFIWKGTNVQSFITLSFS